MSRAAPLPKRGGGEAGCSSFSARALFSAVCPPAFLFFALGLHTHRRLRVFSSENVVDVYPACVQTDKASMLDEIIDYVKFLQLQVKASMN